MSQQCSVSSGTTMILACSGGSNVGQLSNQAAVELTQEGAGKMFCLAGIGGRLKNFLDAAGEARSILAVDGCAIGCARAILQNAGIANYDYLVLTELGIEKTKNLVLARSDIEQVKQAAKQAMAGGSGAPAPFPAAPEPGCKCR